MAFAVGLGLTVGKYVGGMVNAALDGVVLGISSLAAEKGSVIAQQALDRANVQYKKEETEPDKVVGFHP